MCPGWPAGCSAERDFAFKIVLSLGPGRYMYIHSRTLDTNVYTYIIANMAVRLPCYCATLRQAARAISQKYDAALRGTQLTITQFTLLTALAECDRPRVNDLADALSMDQTTLSRTLRIMERDGLIAAVAGEDRRETRWIITPRGKDRRKRALPRWSAAQRDIEKLLGPDLQRMSSAAFELSTRLSTSA